VQYSELGDKGAILRIIALLSLSVSISVLFHLQLYLSSTSVHALSQFLLLIFSLSLIDKI
jgi:hypothetical protein